MERFVIILSSGISQGAIYALIALGIVLLQQATGAINFAQGDLLSLGAFVGFWLIAQHHMPQLAAYPLVLVILFVAGVGLERLGYAPLRKRSSIAVIISTFALGSAIRACLALWYQNVPRALPSPLGTKLFHIAGAAISDQDLLIIIVTAGVLVLLFFLMQVSPIGRQLRALADDRETAILQGIRVNSLSPLLFGLSSALAGLAGLLVAPQLSVSPTLGFNLLLTTFAAVILGGNTLGGVTFAAFFVSLVQAMAAGYVNARYIDAYPYVILVVVLALRPTGLRRMVAGVRY
jgi:branched-chain amino acid transport system permease protein